MSGMGSAGGPVSRWVPVIVWAGVIWALSSDAFSGGHTSGLLVPLLNVLLPGASPETLLAAHAAVRKLAHVVEYAVLAVLVFRALARPDRSPARTALASLLLCVAYAVLDEVHQTFVPTRLGAPLDVALDGLGAALGIAARLVLGKLSAGRRSPA